MISLRLATVVGVALFVPAALLAACTTDAATVPPGDGSSSSSSGSSGSAKNDGGGADASDAGVLLNACRSFVDRSAEDADRTLPWDFGITQLEIRCMKIKKGQTVTFATPDAGPPADFGEHPPVPRGGDTPNPFSDLDRDTGKVVFEKAGLFGFVCNIHGGMAGAVLVTE